MNGMGLKLAIGGALLATAAVIWAQTTDSAAGGTAVAEFSQTQSAAPAATGGVSPGDPRAQRPGPAIGLTRAVDMAESRWSAHAIEAELDHERGRSIYEIELFADDAVRHVWLDAESGETVRESQPRIENSWRGWFDEELARAGNGQRLATLLAALERSTGGRALEANFEVERGRAFYEVEIATDAGVTEVHLDAGTGERLAMDYND